VDSQHSRQRVRQPTSLVLRVIASHFLLQLFPRNQFIHSFQKDLATGPALLVLALGFGEGDLDHDGSGFFPVDYDRIIADSEAP
jgi:hypothetical protein